MGILTDPAHEVLVKTKGYNKSKDLRPGQIEKLRVNLQEVPAIVITGALSPKEDQEDTKTVEQGRWQGRGQRNSNPKCCPSI